MRLAVAASLLLGTLVAVTPLAGKLAPLSAASPKKADDKKAEEVKAPPPPKEPIEPLPIVEPARLPSGRHAYDLMRELRQLQDKVANGDADSIVGQRALIDKMAEDFQKADDAVWQDPRNGRALLAYVLSGGDVKVLRAILLRGQPKSVDPNFGRAVHAFASNRRGEALEHFGKLDPLTLDPAIAGQVALAQAEFMARTDLDKALEKLDIARLLGPGTLLEEAALRRKIFILSGQKKFAEADRMMEVYFRRFPKSGYGGGLKRQVVRFMSERPPLEDAAQTQPIVAAIDRLAKRDQIEMYVEMAKEGTSRGRRDVVNFAAEKALALAEAGSSIQARSKLYLAAMHVASLEAEKVKAEIEEMKPTVQGKEEQELIAASQSIADEIYRVATVTPTDTPDPAWHSELGKTFSNVGKAHALLVEADRLLLEATK